ncbi:MAG TPA: alpha/beta hydrolase [Acidimicrobiaceae bacterium]|nr:alpha/beta hydrolase [Acidimicrobiaceae bacterium]
MTAPVVLVHGWGGSFAATWQRSGFTELLADAGRAVIGVDLLGHGTAPKPHDPDAYADLGARVLEVLPDEPVDAVGFSLGAITLLRLAMRHPHRFQRLVLAGVGRNILEPDPDSARRIVAALDGDAADDDTHALLFAQYANQPGNDPVALAAIMRRSGRDAPSPADFAAVTCPTLVVIGDKDFAGPGDPLVAALPNATLKVLRNVDHFATPEAFEFIDAALEFLDAVPA